MFCVDVFEVDRLPCRRRYANKHPNLSVLAWDGAVIGTRPGGYGLVDPSSIGSGRGFSVEEGTDKSETGTGLGRFTLGDFHNFGLFLETQFGIKLDV